VERKSYLNKRLRWKKCTPDTPISVPKTPVKVDFYTPPPDSSSSSSPDTSISVPKTPVQVNFYLPPPYFSSSSSASSCLDKKPPPIKKKVRFNLPTETSLSSEEIDLSDGQGLDTTNLVDEYDVSEVDWDLIPDYTTTGNPEKLPSVMETTTTIATTSSLDYNVTTTPSEDYNTLVDSLMVCRIVNSYIGDNNAVKFPLKYEASVKRKKSYISGKDRTQLTNAIIQHGFNTPIILENVTTTMTDKQVYLYVHGQKYVYLHNCIIEDYLGVKCCWCGATREESQKGIEYDHLNESHNVIHLSKKSVPIKKYLVEVPNCRCLCYKCHKMRSNAQMQGKKELFDALKFQEQHQL
jgi:hypothetical protein